MRLALASTNPLVGDISGNAALIADRIAAAALAHADLILLPELVLSGYPPRDLLTHEFFLARCEEAAHTLAQHAPRDITIIFGTPLAMRDTDGKPTLLATNSLLAFRNGELLARYDKQLLPTYDVFDEDRYFEPGTRPITLDIPTAHGSTRVGLTICEDLWKGQDAGFSNRYRDVIDPVDSLVARGAQVILSALSPASTNSAATTISSLMAIVMFSQAREHSPHLASPSAMHHLSSTPTHLCKRLRFHQHRPRCRQAIITTPMT
jgi:predicted amidohydrolase